MSLLHSKVCLSIVIFVSFHAFSVHCIDSHGNAIYTFMELSQLLDEWCAEVNWTKSFMGRLIACRHSLTPEDMRPLILDCVKKSIPDIDMSKLYEEPGERALACKFQGKEDGFKVYTDIWNCIHPEPAKLAEFNDKLRVCMAEKARKEEDEFMKAG